MQTRRIISLARSQNQDGDSSSTAGQSSSPSKEQEQAQTLSENEADESIERSKSLLDPISDVKGKNAFTNVSASDIPFKSSQTPQLATLTPPSVVELETCAKGFGMHSMDRPGPSSGLVKQAVLGGAAQTNASGPISTVAPNPPTHPSLETPPADQQPTQEEEPEIHIKGKGNITDSASTTAGASVQPSPAAIGSSATTPATGVAMPMFSHANDGHALNDIAINVEEEGEPLRTSETQWWICLRDLEFAPSVMHAGYTVMEERSRRGRSVSFLLRLTDYLRLPINVTSAACIFFHRFFMRQCMTPANGSNIKVGKSFMPQCVAAACVFLACKTEESPRKVVHVIEAAVAASDRTEEGREAFECRDYAKRFGRARRRKDTGEIYDYRLVIDEEEVARDALRPGVKGAAQRDDRLWGPVRWKQNILTTEMWLAQALCFDFIVFHPHEYLIIMARELNFSNKIFWSAWFILVDCFRDPILIAFQRTVLVAAAYKLGCDRWEISPSHLDKHVQSMEVDDDLQETQKQSSSWTWLNAFGVSEFEVAEAARAIEDMQAIHADMTIPVEESLKARIPEMLRREVQRQNRSVAACFPDAVSKPSALRTWKACNAPTPPSLPGPPLPLGPAPAGNGRTPSYMPGSLPSQPSASRIQQNGATVAPPPSAVSRQDLGQPTRSRDYARERSPRRHDFGTDPHPASRQEEDHPLRQQDAAQPSKRSDGYEFRSSKPSGKEPELSAELAHFSHQPDWKPSSFANPPQLEPESSHAASQQPEWRPRGSFGSNQPQHPCMDGSFSNVSPARGNANHFRNPHSSFPESQGRPFDGPVTVSRHPFQHADSVWVHTNWDALLERRTETQLKLDVQQHLNQFGHVVSSKLIHQTEREAWDGPPVETLKGILVEFRTAEIASEVLQSFSPQGASYTNRRLFHDCMPRLEYSRKSPEMLHVSGLGNVSKREFESPAHFDEEVATFFGGPSCVRSVRGLWEFKASPRLKGIYFDFDSPQTAREVCARGNGLEFEGQRLRLEFKGTGPTAAPNPGLLGGSVAAPGLGGRQSFRKIRFDAPQKVVNLRFISPPDGGEFDVRDLSPFNTAAEPDGRYHVSKLLCERIASKWGPVERVEVNRSDWTHRDCFDVHMQSREDGPRLLQALDRLPLESGLRVTKAPAIPSHPPRTR